MQTRTLLFAISAKLRFVLLLAICVTAKPGAAATPLRIKMGLHNFPPDFIVSSDGQSCGGPGFELTRRIFAMQQIEVEAVCVTPARMYLLLDSGELDLTINIKSTKALTPHQGQHLFVSPPTPSCSW